MVEDLGLRSKAINSFIFVGTVTLVGIEILHDITLLPDDFYV